MGERPCDLIISELVCVRCCGMISNLLSLEPIDDENLTADNDYSDRNAIYDPLLHVFLCESGAVKNTTDECVRSCFPLAL